MSINYNQSAGGIAWTFNNLNGDQFNIGGSAGGIQNVSETPEKSLLTKISIPQGTKRVILDGNRWKIDGDYYTDGSYEIFDS